MSDEVAAALDHWVRVRLTHLRRSSKALWWGWKRHGRDVSDVPVEREKVSPFVNGERLVINVVDVTK
jgi:hypothetical protein